MGFEVIIINLILAIPIFILVRLIFEKIKVRSIRIAVTLISTLVLTLMVYVGIITLWLSVAMYYPKEDFDKDKWKSDVKKRYEMTDDLVNNKKLIGKTKEEIIQLLGQEENIFESDEWTYNVGFRPSMFGIDPDILEIEFKDDKVIKCITRET
jgi:hypothetical protein